MAQDEMDDELYDDIMEAYAEGFVPGYGGSADGEACSGSEAEQKKPSVVAVSASASGDFPEDIPF